MSARSAVTATIVAVLIALVAAPDTVRAADPVIASSVKAADLPELKRTSTNLYVTAKEAAALLAASPSLLLIDVRTTAEPVFLGLAKPTFRNVPYLVLDDTFEFDDKAGRYKLVANPDFPKAIELLFAERKLARDAPVILTCTSGERSAKAASYLASLGYTRVYSMVDGLEGDDAPGMPGWKRAGMPWTFTMTKAQAYKSPSF